MHSSYVTDPAIGYVVEQIAVEKVPHIAVFAEYQPPFVTQMYIQGEPRNEEGFLFNSVPGDRRHKVLAEFKSSTQSDADLEARFDIVRDQTHGTPDQA